MVPFPTSAAAAISSTVGSMSPRLLKIRMASSMIRARVSSFFRWRREGLAGGGALGDRRLVTAVIYDYGHIMRRPLSSHFSRNGAPRNFAVLRPTPQRDGL